MDVAAGQLLDVVQGHDASPAVRWLAARTPAWRQQIECATLDMSGLYRSVFDTMLPDAVQVADPFHLVRVRREGRPTTVNTTPTWSGPRTTHNALC